VRVKFLNTKDLWAVIGDHGETLSKGHTHAGAWREVDRLKREPINRQEDVTEWLARKNDQ
jgi:hypothetical protein